jgi:hypothetical protein
MGSRVVCYRKESGTLEGRGRCFALHSQSNTPRSLGDADHIASRVNIAEIPDNILLDLFDFYRMDSQGSGIWAKAWQRLVHVCRRWRYVVFGSPLRLHLYLFCTGTTPVRKTLDVWPRLPIEISTPSFDVGDSEDNIIAALEQHDRVSQIWLHQMSLPCERFYTSMQQPFPELQNLRLWSTNSTQALRDNFLGGSAPRLRYLFFFNIPFPGLPKFLSSCNDLVDLHLHEIPNTGYISPEAMVTGLSALTRLKDLAIMFEFPYSDSFPDRRIRRTPLLIRAALSSLTRFRFQGVSEYLEDLLARISAPFVEILR